MSTHGPIDANYRELMQVLAKAIDEAFNQPGKPKQVAFALLMAETGKMDGGRVNYISNGERSDMLTMLREYLARAEGRHAEETQQGAPRAKQ